MKVHWLLGLVLILMAVAVSGCALVEREPAATSAPSPVAVQPTATDGTSASALQAPPPTPEPPTPVPPTLMSPTPMSAASVPEVVPSPGDLSGVVVDAAGPVKGATVRVQLTEIETTSAAGGSFTLADLSLTEPVSITAWAEGYYVGGATAWPSLEPVTITLKAHYTTDNLDYEWFTFQGVEGSESCAPCHHSYDEWKADAHSQSAVNPRFLSMYQGTDVHGNRSPVEYDASGRLKLPDPDQPYYGPGLKLDYPDRAGNCASCHTPLASNLDPANTCGWSGCHTEWTAQYSDEVPSGISPLYLEGVAADGIACDFCHKIGEVFLDPETKLPLSTRPGISSMRLYRPEEGEQLFFGTFDDVTRRVTYLPLEEESAFCAPCHYGVFGGVAGHTEVAGGVEVYNSYGEWLESPYADPETGQTCQDCHMPATDYDYFAYPEFGGLQPRRPIHNHTMPGVNDLALMQNSVTMTTTAGVNGDEVVVEVSITNDKTGHHVPTGAPLRHMILVVQATDAGGQPLPLAGGPLLPEWTGDYAGLPGRYYAKILEDKWSGEVPTPAYWRDIRLVEDTRLAAFATDESTYTFEAPDEGPVTVETRLVYRRAFQELMEQKDWD
ncbi:MAG: hypothetical protein PVI80_13255, partial [Anaerolineae bacterium]